MESPPPSLFSKRLIVVAGKGGVGKSTVSAALALVAARRGKRVLLCEIHGTDRIAHFFEAPPVGPTIRQLRPNLFLLGLILLEVPTGAVADNWGRKWSLVLGALVLALAVLIFAYAETFPVLLTSFLLWSLASAPATAVQVLAACSGSRSSSCSAAPIRTRACRNS